MFLLLLEPFLLLLGGLKLLLKLLYDRIIIPADWGASAAASVVLKYYKASN